MRNKIKMTNIKDLKGHPGVDIDAYDGQKSIVEKVYVADPIEVEFNGKKDTVTNLVVETANLAKEGQEIRAREYVRLFEKDGELGYSEGKNSKAVKILNFFKVNNFEDIMGKECLVVKRVRNNNAEFLGIHVG